ncbi:hypothetical protein G9A89_010324 [Geosiphon pyriformis]|nr:hypothetical protein G9A89_010324 [Geosiphon pyriformis]
MSLDYVDNAVFSGVIEKINMSELFSVISNLPNNKSVVKRYEHLYRYKIDTKFVARSGKVETTGRKTSFFAASIFINDMIWVGSCQTFTQYILNIASEFFKVNNILINNDKTVAILINQRVNLAQVHVDIRFFSNVVLKKAITDKQFSYLVLAILQPIISYHIQFSFVSSASLRSKAGLPHDFSSETLYHLSLYSVKPFNQVQPESKLASLIFFSNVCGIFGRLLEHKFLDLQVLKWFSLDFLQHLVKLRVNLVNNFLAGVVKIFLENKLSLAHNLSSAFHNSGKFPMSGILGYLLYYDFVISLKHFGIAFSDRLLNKKGRVMNWKTFRQWKKLDLRGSVPYWFTLAAGFIGEHVFLRAGSTDASNLQVLSVLKFEAFFDVHSSLLEIWSDCIEVYTNRSLKSTGFVEMTSSAAAYFLAANMSVEIRVHGLLSSTLAELQAIALVLECVLSSCAVVLYLDSQSVINACVSEILFAIPDFCNCCWVERLHIVDLIKRHSGVLGNVRADELAGIAACSLLFLLVGSRKKFLVAENTVVSGNTHYFVHDIYQSICYAHWEAGPEYDIIPNTVTNEIDWAITAKIWHPNSHMLSEFTGRYLANMCTYLIKAVHRQLSVTIRKRLYKKSYFRVLCLQYGDIKLSDYCFVCSDDIGLHGDILEKAAKK